MYSERTFEPKCQSLGGEIEIEKPYALERQIRLGEVSVLFWDAHTDRDARRVYLK